MRTDINLQANNRVYVAGCLSSKNKFLDNRQIIQAFTIKARVLELKDATEVEPDINRTKITGEICSQLKHTDKFSIFTMKCSYIAG